PAQAQRPDAVFHPRGRSRAAGRGHRDLVLASAAAAGIDAIDERAPARPHGQRMRGLRMKSNLALAPAAAALVLAACDDAPPRQPTEPEPTPAVAPSATRPPTSIIRPDVIAAQKVKPPLGPLETTVPFAEGGSELSAAAERALTEVLASDQLAEGWPVVLRGHTDSVGHDEANLRASRRRAEAVAEWLVENGVNEDRIAIIALGEQRPVAPNALPDGRPDEPGRARNRRVTISIAPASPEGPEDAPAEQEPAADG